MGCGVDGDAAGDDDLDVVTLGLGEFVVVVGIAGVGVEVGGAGRGAGQRRSGRIRSSQNTTPNRGRRRTGGRTARKA